MSNSDSLFHFQNSPQKAVALLCYENERPLQRLIGKLDWKLNGVFTDLLRKGIITGQKNEMGYVPFKWNENTFHFLILGAGENSVPGKRTRLREEEKKKLNQKAQDLGLSNLIIEGENEANGN